MELKTANKRDLQLLIIDMRRREREEAAKKLDPLPPDRPVGPAELMTDVGPLCRKVSGKKKAVQIRVIN